MLKDVPRIYLSAFVKALKKGNKAAAIKAKCLDCVCFQRVEITNCTAKDCPLWVHRPYQVKGKEDESMQ